MEVDKYSTDVPEWDEGQYIHDSPTPASRWVGWILRDALIGLMGPNPLPDEDISATQPLHIEGE